MSADKERIEVDALVFGIDGVLVDVNESRRQAVIQTTDIFFHIGMGFVYEDEPISLLDEKEVDLLKISGGFTSDWDLTTAAIIYFLEMLSPFPLHTLPVKRHVPAVLAYLQAVKGSKSSVTIDMLRQNKDIFRLARLVNASGGGMIAIDKVLTHRNRHLINTGDNLLNGNLIQRIFQELYLGESLFEEIYATKPVVVQAAGLINNEELLVNQQVLEKLNNKMNLGIATDRSKAEAQYALNRLCVVDLFKSLVTRDDILVAQAKAKPDPWSLLEAARRLYPTPARSAYIGHTPNDIIAAKAANDLVPFLAIGCLTASLNQRALRQQFSNQNADVILNHPDNLLELITV